MSVCPWQCSDFGPKTALKVIGTVRERVLAGELKTGNDIRTALKESIVDILISRGGDTELKLRSSKWVQHLSRNCCSPVHLMAYKCLLH